MPFTFAHPAILLPLRYLPRRWISWTGLIIGSMAPDFEYFLRMKIKSSYSHSFPGLLWFNLPLAFTLALIFHGIVRNTLIDSLPYKLHTRLIAFKSFRFASYLTKHWHVFAVSAIVGSLSHVFWDSFTHEHGFFVKLLSGLQTSIAVGQWRFPAYKALQHLSTLTGLVIIAFVIWRLPPSTETVHPKKWKFWILALIITALIILTRLVTGLDYHQYGHLIATSISAVFIALILASLLLRAECQ